MERAQLSVEWLQSARLDRGWTQEKENLINRRNALRRIAVLPIEV